MKKCSLQSGLQYQSYVNLQILIENSLSLTFMVRFSQFQRSISKESNLKPIPAEFFNNEEIMEDCDIALDFGKPRKFVLAKLQLNKVKSLPPRFSPKYTHRYITYYKQLEKCIFGTVAAKA